MIPEKTNTNYSSPRFMQDWLCRAIEWIRTYVRTYVRAYVRTYIRSYVFTYVHMYADLLRRCEQASDRGEGEKERGRKEIGDMRDEDRQTDTHSNQSKTKLYNV